MNRYVDTLNKKGIVEIPCRGFQDEQLLGIASMFGHCIPGARGEMVQLLPAREKGTGPRGSFSDTVGYGPFPWHTDTAYWETPVHYLLLASENESPCATIYQDLESIKQSLPDFEYLMTRAVFLLDIPNQRRYLSPLFKMNGEKGYRIDFHIYRPVNQESKILMRQINKMLNDSFIRHIWTGNHVVVLDNWRMIHARENASNDKNRILKRIYINELV